MLVHYAKEYQLFDNTTKPVALPVIDESDPYADREAPPPPAPEVKQALPTPSLQVIKDIHAMLQNNTNFTAPDFGDAEIPNKEYKESRTLKTLVYALGLNEIIVRVTNLQDRFDGQTALVQQFDVNAWAREFYLEANYHLNKSEELMKDLRVQITEMNLGGSVEMS